MSSHATIIWGVVFVAPVLLLTVIHVCSKAWRKRRNAGYWRKQRRLQAEVRVLQKDWK